VALALPPPELTDGILPPPELTDGIVRLRPWNVRDLGCVEAASTVARISEATTVPVPYTHAEGEAFIRRQLARTSDGQGWSLAITDGASGDALGCAALLLRPQPGVAGIGFWLVPAARGRGVATRAVGLLTGWGLATAGLDRIEAWVEPDNDPSVAVLRRCGFRHEGRLRSLLTYSSRRADALVFARLSIDDACQAWPVWAREPVRIIEPDPSWPRLAATLQVDLAPRLAPYLDGPIEHVGSTAVPGLPAKPVIDLLAPVRSLQPIEDAEVALSGTGWHLVPPDLDDRSWRRLFVLPDGARRVAHLHLVEAAHPKAQEELRFRDLLRVRPDLARIYAEVKRFAASTYEYDREAYTAAKAGVIRAMLEPTSEPPGGRSP
jgi:[ribosomal protein S5]-alanine N-acetyltransferase